MSCYVSVIVPTRDRPELLSRCLSALVEQDFEPTAYEIIVADDAASPETQRLVEYWADRIGCMPNSEKSSPLLRYIPVLGGHGPAAARNVGWQAASGEILAFTDDDCIPDRHWLSQGVAAFNETVIGVSGRLIMPLLPAPTDYEYNAAQLEKGQFVTANCFYRRRAIAQVHGFDERFTTAWREDSDLFFSLLDDWQSDPQQLAPHFVQAVNAIVVHPVRQAAWGVSLSQQRKSFFNALLYKKHPKRYRQWLQPVTPWHYYGIVISLLVALGLGIRSVWQGWTWETWMAIAASLLWLLLTTQFCLRRLYHTSHHPLHILEIVVTSLLIPPLSLFWRLAGALYFRVLFF